MKKYKKYKESGIEWIGEIPEHWNRKKLSYCFDKIGSGTTPKSTNQDYYFNGKFNWLQTGDLNDGEITNTSKMITQKALDNYSTLRFYPSESIVIAMYGATIGKMGLLNIETTTNQACCVLAEPKNVISKFVFYWFQSIKKHIISISYGGGQPNINQEQIRTLQIQLPPKQEQTQIANYLDQKTTEIDQLITQKETLLKLYEEEKTAIINQAVTKGIVTSSGVEMPNVKLKDSGVDWLGQIPVHWKVKRLKYIGDAIMGMVYSPKEIVQKDGNLVLRSSNIQDGKLCLKDTVYINKTIPEKLVVKIGDILICSRNGSRRLIGKNITIDERTQGQTFGAFMTVFRTEQYVFISNYFNSQVFSGQSGLFLTSTINQLTINTINNFYTALPPKEEQTQIVEYLKEETNKINTKVNKTKKGIALLKEYKTALISEVVTGKIKI